MGWTMPVLVDEGGSIIAGHGRVLAAGRMGLVDVPVMVARGWSETQKRAYLIAANKLTENASLDQAKPWSCATSWRWASMLC
jgi:ParB-like chromosome segregation protein Spo0J